MTDVLLWKQEANVSDPSKVDVTIWILNVETDTLTKVGSRTVQKIARV